MGGSLMSGWSKSKNYTISVIDKKKYAILKKKNRNKKIKFFKSIDDINNQNNLDYIIFATRPLELTNVFKELKTKKTVNKKKTIMFSTSRFLFLLSRLLILSLNSIIFHHYLHMGRKIHWRLFPLL